MRQYLAFLRRYVITASNHDVPTLVLQLPGKCLLEMRSKKSKISKFQSPHSPPLPCPSPLLPPRSARSVPPLSSLQRNIIQSTHPTNQSPQSSPLLPPKSQTCTSCCAWPKPRANRKSARRFCYWRAWHILTRTPTRMPRRPSRRSNGRMIF